MKDALPRGVNGFPMFMTIYSAGHDDAERIMAKYKEIKSAVEEA